MQTLLIVGFGDIARRALAQLSGHWRLLALVRSDTQRQAARQAGVTPLCADLDDRRSLERLAGLADAVLYTAPPAASGHEDVRLKRLLSALTKNNSIPQHWVYISTTGVYGNRAGAWLDECSAPLPETARARRRLDAECQLRRLAQRYPVSISILRAPGIYAAERLPLERLRQHMPLPLATEDVFTNHIHADDLAAIAVRALRRRGGIRIFNACDSEPLLTGEWFDALADHAGLPHAPRMARAGLEQALTPQGLSFLCESRRLCNKRIHQELGIRLRYPTTKAFLTLPALALDGKIR